ncbi:MAG: hypothetical protein F4145_16695 [Boseongicola sp. SB0675_bin_26]|nr:hypothetical protein [Boseongicola sp. SB0675_bin_26]
MSEFDARTATQAEFEAEARRTHAEVVARIDAMTDLERQAFDEFGMPGYLNRVRTLHLNNISSLKGLEENIATCLAHWKNDQWQSSDEYTVAFDKAHNSGDFHAVMSAAKAEFYKRFETSPEPEPETEAATVAPAFNMEQAKAAAEDKVDSLARTRSRRKTRAILGDLLEELKVA